jgi:hypothetical protein
MIAKEEVQGFNGAEVTPRMPVKNPGQYMRPGP